MTTVADLLRARADDDRPGLVTAEGRFSWREHVAASADRAAWLAQGRRDGWLRGRAGGDGPFHVGILLDNDPEFSFLLGATALAGAVTVGLNDTRGPLELARDIAHTECAVVCTTGAHAERLAGLDLGGARLVDVHGEEYRAAIDALAGAALPDVPVTDADLFMLIFTSGTTAAPKAVRCSHGKIAAQGGYLGQRFLTAEDVAYGPMPLFHSNAVIAGWTPALAAGATIALRDRFSASGFLPDVRRFGATYANYVGKALAYVLATPQQPDDADNPLRVVFGNEASERDAAAFGRRFGCHVVDGFGSTEGGVSLQRPPEAPAGSLGRPSYGDVRVLDPVTGDECPAARFDAAGRLLNADEAIGELVNCDGAGAFEGYWRNDAAESERLRAGRYHTGDLAYRDADGWFYFAGRMGDRIRVDGENLAVAAIERALGTHPDVVQVAVYAVPDPQVGDQVMAALQLADGARLDGAAFLDWLRARGELGEKAYPRFLRIVGEMPRTATNKVVKRGLVRDAWRTDDPVWWRPDSRADGDRYRPLTAEDVAALDAAVAARA